MSTVETTAEAVQSTAPVLTLTPAAIKQVRHLIARKGGQDLGLRVGVRGGGCSGLSYFLDLEPAPRDGDQVLDFDGLRVFIDPKSARFIAGTTVDYSLKNLLEGGWVFTNPNAGRTCGCGTSFQPKA